MAETTYSYTVSTDFPSGAVNTDKLETEIQASSIVTALERIDLAGDDIDIVFKDSLSTGDKTTLDNDTTGPAGGLIAAHDNTDSPATDEVVLKDARQETDGRIRVYQTARPVGTKLIYSILDDDQGVGGDEFEHVWGGKKLIITHTNGDGVGSDNKNTAYMDLNTIENSTYLRAGIPVFDGATCDEVSVECVNQVTDTSAGSNTDYSLYGGYLIVPAAMPGMGEGAGAGTLVVADADMRLIQILPNEEGVSAQGFWDADWNSSTKEFENVTANLTGTGGYNMFSLELVLSNFAPLLVVCGDSNGISALRSEESERIPHGIRIKLTATTSAPDHDWNFGINFVMYREKTA
jgi:hypothetical protein